MKKLAIAALVFAFASVGAFADETGAGAPAANNMAPQGQGMNAEQAPAKTTKKAKKHAHAKKHHKKTKKTEEGAAQ